MEEQVVGIGRPDAARDPSAPKLPRSWTRSNPSSLDPHSRFPFAHHREAEPFFGPEITPECEASLRCCKVIRPELAGATDLRCAYSPFPVLNLGGLFFLHRQFELDR